MITQEIKKIIENNTIALSTCKNNEPYVIAVSCVKVTSETELIITDNFMKTTIDNIKQNNNVSLAVWNDNLGYQIRGLAEYYTLGKYLDYVQKIPENKGMPCKGAIIVKVNNIKKLLG